MKTMILAAGRGERMRPLTDHTPKPLLMAGGKPLIVWHLERLAAHGFVDVVINHAHLGEKIEAALGNGQTWGLNIRYSAEPPGALETAGGIAKALPLLSTEPFLVLNGDIWCDWNIAQAKHRALQLATGHAHLVFVDNPSQHAGGDFCLEGTRVRYASAASEKTSPTLTYAGTGVFSPEFFAQVPVGSIMKMRPLLDAGIAQGIVSGEHHRGEWVDVGTVERLKALDIQLNNRNIQAQNHAP